MNSSLSPYMYKALTLRTWLQNTERSRSPDVHSEMVLDRISLSIFERHPFLLMVKGTLACSICTGMKVRLHCLMGWSSLLPPSTDPRGTVRSNAEWNSKPLRTSGVQGAHRSCRLLWFLVSFFTAPVRQTPTEQREGQEVTFFKAGN